MLQGLRGEGSGVFAAAERTDVLVEEQVDPTQQFFVACGNCGDSHSSAAYVKECYAITAAAKAKDRPTRSTYSTKPNRYVGKCSECGGWIEAEAGLLGGKVDGRWTVLHKDGDCHGVTETVAPAYSADVIVWDEGIHVDDYFAQRYTVAFADGTHKTLSLRFGGDKAGTGDFFAGRVMIDMLTGPDNTSNYSNVAHVRDDGTVHINLKYRANASIAEAIRVLVGDPKAAAEAYGLFSEQCFRCHAELTVPASIERGMGPDCAKKAGW